MRRLAIALAISVALFALVPGAATAAPEKNDSVNGHGFVVFDPTTTYNFKVSAHTLSSTTTAATGNMYIEAVQISPDFTLTLKIWADVYCISALSYQAEVRGHITRSEPALGEQLDLIFDVSDLSSFTTLPDLFDATTNAPGAPCTEPPPPGLNPIAKGNVTVTDESP